MKLTLATLLALAPVAGARDTLPKQPDSRVVKTLAKAIYIAEGAEKASVPYGIMSQPVRSKDHARRICEASIRRNWERWVDAGCPGPDFVAFMARRWAPVGAENDDRNLNREWPDNVRRWFYKLVKEET